MIRDPTPTPEIPIPVDTPTYLAQLETLLVMVIESDHEGGEMAQRAKILLDNVGAIAQPGARIDRLLLDGCNRAEEGLNLIRLAVQDRSRA